MNEAMKIVELPVCEPDEITKLTESLIQSMQELQAAAETVGKRYLVWATFDDLMHLAGTMMMENRKKIESKNGFTPSQDGN